MANPPNRRTMRLIGSKRIGIEEYSMPDQAFRAFYRIPSETKLKILWRSYLDWRKSKCEDDYKQFDQYIKSCSQKAKNDVEAMPNPMINGKKGLAYSCTFEMPPSVCRYTLKGLDSSGLDFELDKNNPLKCRVFGMPEKPGEFIVKLVYCGYGGILETHERKFALQIIPDPKDLWRDIPTDKNIEYFKNDLDGELLETNDCVLLAASRRGRSHAHAALPRDDDFKIAFDRETGWSLMVVADGAGSAEYSRKGSQIACHAAIDYCLKKLEANAGFNDFFNSFTAASLNDAERVADARKLVYSILPQAAFEAHKAIREEAREMGREAKQYATTLLMAMVKKYSQGWIVLSFQVGDGAMGILQKRDGMLNSILLAEPDEGEYGGQTRFITMNDIFEPNELMRRLRVDFVHDFEAMLLMTDGISDAYFSALSNLQDPAHWKNLWQDIRVALSSGEPVKDLLDWLNFWSQGNHDDRTIAVLYPASRTGAGE